ncbi:MAG: MdtA/MuxA family multidrug efflux RND transporter periplasmic adaptor subunit [Proteobacteria bacterium]|nr:MdtA/MuxA family multidrug efflux RND transporter periplasmic adaptor subunit [Pseudomonadota bacterium]
MNDLTARRQAEEHRLDFREVVPERSSNWRRAAWLVVLVALAAGVAWWISSRPAPPTGGGRFSVSGPMPVVAATAQKGEIGVRLSALGTVIPLATVTVRTQIAGQLTRIAFEEGQKVKKGDLLAEIDSRPYEAALRQVQGQLLRDQALLKNAELDLQRYRTLVAQDSIPRQQLDTQAALVGQYEGVVKTDQAMVDNAKLNLDYCRIQAPVSGRVGLRLVDQGNYLQAGDATGIAVINQVQPISVIFTVPEDEVSAVTRRMRQGTSLEVAAFDRALSSRIATGKLTTVDNQIDTSTGTVKLKAQFDNEDERLFPNQFVNIQLLVDTLRDATVIPGAAVLRGAPGTFVYVLKPDDSVAVQPVTLGPAEGDRVAIRSGLAPGDRVVVDGADKLRDGAKISLRDPASADAPAPSRGPGSQQQQRRRGSTQ